MRLLVAPVSSLPQRLGRWYPLLAVGLICVPLSLRRDPYTGWDAEAHIEYMKFVAYHWRVPFNGGGWQMYQPPAYYFLAALVYRSALPASQRVSLLLRGYPFDHWALKAVQLLTFLFTLLQIVVVLALLSYFCKRERDSYSVSRLFVIFLPMQIYSSQFISNEMMSSVMISLVLYLVVRIVSRHDFGWKWSILLGFALSVACLTKYTGLMALASTVYVYAVLAAKMRGSQRRLCFAGGVVIITFLVLAGPFYLANCFIYGTPVYFPQFSRTDFTLDYRGVRFFLDPTHLGLGAVDKFLSRSTSFIDGNYSSMWLDISHTPQAWSRPIDFAIYCLAIVPVMLILKGAVRSMRVCGRVSEGSERDFVILVYMILSIAGYVQFVLRLFSFEIVRAFYLLSTVGPLAVFFCRGFDQSAEEDAVRGRVRIAMIALCAICAAYYAAVPWLTDGSS